MRRVVPLEIITDGMLLRVVSASIGEVVITPTDHLEPERTEAIITNILIARKLGWEVMTGKVKGYHEHQKKIHSYVRSPEKNIMTGFRDFEPISEYEAFLLLGGKEWKYWNIQKWAGDMNMILPLIMAKYAMTITASEGVYYLTVGDLSYSETEWLKVSLRLSQMYVQLEGLINVLPTPESD